MAGQYKPTDKLSYVIANDYRLLQVMSRFGISFGFGEKSIKEICQQKNVDAETFIAEGRNFGVLQSKDFNADKPETYTHAHFALGSYVKAQYLKKDILKNLDLYARIELFYDYAKPKNMAWGNMEEDSRYTLRGKETFEQLSQYNWLKKRAFETDLDFELKLDYRLASFISANFALNLKWDTDYSGMGNWGHWQVYQMAGVQFFLNWKTPKASAE